MKNENAVHFVEDDYRSLAQRLADEYAAGMPTRDAARQAQARQASRDNLLRAGVSALESESERLQREWDEQAVEAGNAQADRYCDSKNKGATPRAIDPTNKEELEIHNSVLSWIKRAKMRGDLGGRKTLDKKS